MMIHCDNCGWSKDTSILDKHSITNCPKCGAPLFGGLGIAWAR